MNPIQISTNDFLDALTRNRRQQCSVVTKRDAEGPFWDSLYLEGRQLSPSNNNYAATALFKTGSSRRRANYLEALALVFDDPVEFQRGWSGPTPIQDHIECSWVLETSPEKYQAGVFIEGGILESTFTGLMKLIMGAFAPEQMDKSTALRLFRLPNSMNNKKKHCTPERPTGFPVQLVHWSPETRYTCDQLLEAFGFTRQDFLRIAQPQPYESIADDEHPILRVPGMEILARKNGGYEIKCPWAHSHTSVGDEGMIFIGPNRSVRYHCFHAHCAARRGGDLVAYAETLQDGLEDAIRQYKGDTLIRRVKSLDEDSVASEKESLIKEAKKAGVSTWAEVSSLVSPSRQEAGGKSEHDVANIEELQRTLVYHTLSDVYIRRRSGSVTRRPAVLNTYSHLVKNNKELHEVLNAGKDCLVDGYGFAPGQPRVYTSDGVVLFNRWDENGLGPLAEGGVSPWLNLITALYPEGLEHLLGYLAFTIQHPEQKINHGVILSGGKGIGKDCILQPLLRYFKGHAKVISPSMLLDSFNEFLCGTKLLVVNELTTHKFESRGGVHDQLKPILAAPPDCLTVNKKFQDTYQIPNLVSVLCTTNHSFPVPLDGESRRFYFAESLASETEANRERASAVYRWYEKENGASKVASYLMNYDISSFNPSMAPPRTAWSEQVVDASKPRALVFLEERLKDMAAGVHAIPDVTTMSDLHEYLKAGAFVHGFRYEIASPARLSAIAPSGYFLKRQRDSRYGAPQRVIIVRNHEKYENMKTSDVFAEYRPCDHRNLPGGLPYGSRD